MMLVAVERLSCGRSQSLHQSPLCYTIILRVFVGADASLQTARHERLKTALDK
jgi:hypothetical protein